MQLFRRLRNRDFRAQRMAKMNDLSFQKMLDEYRNQANLLQSEIDLRKDQKKLVDKTIMLLEMLIEETNKGICKIIEVNFKIK